MNGESMTLFLKAHDRTFQSIISLFFQELPKKKCIHVVLGLAVPSPVLPPAFLHLNSSPLEVEGSLPVDSAASLSQSLMLCNNVAH